MRSATQIVPYIALTPTDTYFNAGNFLYNAAFPSAQSYTGVQFTLSQSKYQLQRADANGTMYDTGITTLIYGR